jgi:hypothetical protein
LELYPIFYSNEKFILVHGRALRFISSLIHRSGQFLFFWSRLAVGLDLVHGTRAAAVGLGLFFCYRTAPFGLVLSLPQQALNPIDFVLHLPFWSGRREPGCCTILSAARSKPEFFSSFRTVYVSLLDLVHLPLPVSMVPCFAAVALVFTATCCALVFDSFSRDLLACSSCIPASIRPRDCISSFFTLARAADCCQLPISVSVWFRGKPALDFGCFGHRRSSSSGLCYVLVMVDLCSDLDQNPGSFSYTASVR